MQPWHYFVIAIVIVLVVAMIFWRGNWRNAEGEIDLLGVLRTKFKGSTPETRPQPGVKVENAVSATGGLTAQDETGRGADVKGVDTHGDINVISKFPKA